MIYVPINLKSSAKGNYNLNFEKMSIILIFTRGNHYFSEHNLESTKQVQDDTPRNNIYIIISRRDQKLQLIYLQDLTRSRQVSQTLAAKSVFCHFLENFYTGIFFLVLYFDNTVVERPALYGFTTLGRILPTLQQVFM